MPETDTTGPSPVPREHNPLDALAAEIGGREDSAGWVESSRSLEEEVQADIERTIANPDIKKWLDQLGNEASPKYDEETYNHILGVARLVAMVARTYQKELQLSPDNLRNLVDAALLHDIGKLEPEIAALVKLPRKLTSDESVIMAKHAEYSAQMIEEDFENDRMVRALVELHHQIQGQPSYDKEKEKDRLFELGLTDAYSLRKFETMQELLEAVDKCDAVANKRSYQEETPPEKMPLKVASAMFAHFAAAGRDPETGMDMVHRVLKVKYPTMRFICRYTTNEEKAGKDHPENVSVAYEEII